VFNRVCMVFLLEKSIHLITGIVSAVVAVRPAGRSCGYWRERGLIGSNGVGIMRQDTFYAVRADHG